MLPLVTLPSGPSAPAYAAFSRGCGHSASPDGRRRSTGWAAQPT